MMWLSGKWGHGVSCLFTTLGNSIRSPWICTVTSWLPSWYDLRCCQDVKLKETNLARCVSNKISEWVACLLFVHKSWVWSLQGSHRSVQESHRSVQGSNWSVQETHRSVQGSHWSAQGSHRSVHEAIDQCKEAIDQCKEAIDQSKEAIDQCMKQSISARKPFEITPHKPVQMTWALVIDTLVANYPRELPFKAVQSCQLFH